MIKTANQWQKLNHDRNFYVLCQSRWKLIAFVWWYFSRFSDRFSTVVPRIVPTAIWTLRRSVPGFSGTAPRESIGKNRRKGSKMKSWAYFLIVHRAHLRLWTQYRTVLGLDLIRYPTGVHDCHLGLQKLFTPENRTSRRIVPGFSETPYVQKCVVTLYS